MYYKTDVNGSRIPAYEGGDSPLIKDITAATTLTVEDSGKTLVLKAAAGVEVALPDPTYVWEFEVCTGLAFATTDFTLVASDNVIQGGAIVNSVFVPAVNENTISFVATAETLGDNVKVKCDGTNIYVNGVGAAAGSITFTAP